MGQKERINRSQARNQAVADSWQGPNLGSNCRRGAPRVTFGHASDGESLNEADQREVDTARLRQAELRPVNSLASSIPNAGIDEEGHDGGRHRMRGSDHRHGSRVSREPSHKTSKRNTRCLKSAKTLSQGSFIIIL